MKKVLWILGVMVLVFGLAFNASAVTSLDAPNDHSVLILGSTVSGGTGSWEAQAATYNGLTPVVVDDSTWLSMTASNFATYRAIVLGDPMCQTDLSALSAAESNKAVWASVVLGNVFIIGSDVSLHSPYGGTVTVARNGIAFAAAQNGKTGAYIALSCYYHGTSPGTPVSVLSPFGSFTVRGAGGDTCHVVATHPALAGLTDESLSNWGSSTHEAFDGFPGNFIVLATVELYSYESRAAAPSESQTAWPYILVRGTDIVSTECSVTKLLTQASSLTSGSKKLIKLLTKDLQRLQKAINHGSPLAQFYAQRCEQRLRQMSRVYGVDTTIMDNMINCLEQLSGSHEQTPA